MRRQNGLPGSPAGLQDNAAVPERRLSWRKRRRRDRGSTRGTPGTYPASSQAAAIPPMPPASSSGWPAPPGWPGPPGWPAPPGPATSGEIVAGAIQLAIAFLTAGLDSPELEAWAADALTPPGAEGLGDLLAGLHVISVLLLDELHEATEEPPAAILQRLALMAENRRGKPSAG
jgi:hypothetical protein